MRAILVLLERVARLVRLSKEFGERGGGRDSSSVVWAMLPLLSLLSLLSLLLLLWLLLL